MKALLRHSHSLQPNTTYLFDPRACSETWANQPYSCNGVGWSWLMNDIEWWKIFIITPVLLLLPSVAALSESQIKQPGCQCLIVGLWSPGLCNSSLGPSSSVPCLYAGVYPLGVLEDGALLQKSTYLERQMVRITRTSKPLLYGDRARWRSSRALERQSSFLVHYRVRQKSLYRSFQSPLTTASIHFYFWPNIQTKKYHY